MRRVCLHRGVAMLNPAWSATRTVSLLGLLAMFAAMMVDLPAAARAEAIRRPLDLTAAAPKHDAVEFVVLQPYSRSPVERLGDPMIRLEQPQPRRKPAGIQMASLPTEAALDDSLGLGLSESPVRWSASPFCLHEALRKIVDQVAANFGAVIVNSTCRTRRHNAKVGGARHSQHLTGDAVDFSIEGNTRTVLAFLKSHRSVGGLKYYSDGHFHIDTGPRRTW
jgi:hypothetical protein